MPPPWPGLIDLAAMKGRYAFDLPDAQAALGDQARPYAILSSSSSQVELAGRAALAAIRSPTRCAEECIALAYRGISST